MEEKIGDKIRRFANLPHVVEKRRQLRAMYYLAKRERGELTFTLPSGPVEMTSGVRKISTIMIITLEVPIEGSWVQESVEKLLLYPIDTYTSAGEPPRPKWKTRA